MIVAGVAAAGAISALAYRLRALTSSGAIAATVVGAIAFGLGGGMGAGALLTFFVTSTALSRWRRAVKEAMKFEKGGRRDAGQVLANGGVAAVCLVLSACLPGYATPLRLAFLAALAAANADTWGTEIGSAISGKPYSLRDGKPAVPGTSGAVSVGGTLAALAGACIVAIFARNLGHPSAVLLVAGCGFTGAFLDSVAGATLQSQWQDRATPSRWVETPEDDAARNRPDRGLAWVNNDIVNIVCTGSAALLALLLSVVW